MQGAFDLPIRIALQIQHIRLGVQANLEFLTSRSFGKDLNSIPVLPVVHPYLILLFV
jgi:hypothetical protein